jgi:hypothetical protein
MPPAWCEKWMEKKVGFQIHKECVEFHDKLQELKYHHNQKMEKRTTNKTLGIFLCATIFTFLIMLLSPDRFFDQKITLEAYTGCIAVAVFYGAIIGFLLPVVFQAILPPPSEWLPAEFFEIKKARTEMILRQFSLLSQQTNGNG